MKTILVCLLFTLPMISHSMNFHISPYLQRSESGKYSIRWEGRLGKKPLLKLKKMNSGEVLSVEASVIKDHSYGPKSRYLYEAKLGSELTDQSEYLYWIESNGAKSKKYQFTPYKDSEKFSFIVMSDAQHGHKVTTKNIRESVMKHAFSNDEYPPAFSLFAGDLVQHGSKYDTWPTEFFNPLAPLNSRIPVYPAIGNHEENDFLYFSYFDLPKNGSKGYLEHWYYYDFGNIRFVSLDTNWQYRNSLQLEWLRRITNEAKNNEKIDFVIAQFHHPHQSELWVEGETEYSGQLSQILADFTKKTGKPSLYFCGHTHGYSRGHHRDLNHSMFVVGSIGGAIDDWGDYEQRDYPDYQKTLDEHGWVQVLVDANEEKTLKIKRYSFGNDRVQYDQGIVDEFKIKRHNKNPETPIFIKRPKYLLGRSKIRMEISSFNDPDGDEHLSTLVEISDSIDFKKKTSYLVNAENWYMGENKNKGITLNNFDLSKKLELNQIYWIRVKYRDSSLGWSEYSTPMRLVP